MELGAYKISSTRALPLAEDNEVNEPLSTASEAEHLLHHDVDFQHTRLEKLPRWRRLLRKRVSGIGWRSYASRPEEDSCAQGETPRFERKTSLRKCTTIGLWIFASL